MIKVKFLSREAHEEMENKRREAVKSFPGYASLRGGRWPPELYDLNCLFIPPGSLWECHWWFDPENEEDMRDLDERIARASQPDYNGVLSVHYLRDWAHKRPPLCVKLPNYSDWVVDQKSTNGTGWTATTAGPPYEDITCSPSILVPGYHGFLQNGEFTPDLDNGQGPDGVPYWLVNRDK